MNKKLTRGRLVFFILLAIFSVVATALSIYLGIKFDRFGKKPYVIVPTVLLTFGFLFLLVFSLIKILPYAYEHDKKTLRKKTFKHKIIACPTEELKDLIAKNFELNNGELTETTKRSGLFSQIKYTLRFEPESALPNIAENIRANNKKGFDINSKRHSEREVDIYFVEVTKLPSEIQDLETALDEQCLDVLKDPIKVIVPLIFETS